MKVNNVTRFLDAKNIQYKVFELPGGEKLGAEETAQRLDVPLAQVYKTIVVMRPGRGKPILAVVPGTSEMDLKALAKASGEKKLNLATLREAETLTGLQVGGISPLALLKHGFQVFLDNSAQEQGEIHISGGQRGLNIRMGVRDFVSLTQAKVEKICI